MKFTYHSKVKKNFVKRYETLKVKHFCVRRTIQYTFVLMILKLLVREKE